MHTMDIIFNWHGYAYLHTLLIGTGLAINIISSSHYHMHSNLCLLYFHRAQSGNFKFFEQNRKLWTQMANNQPFALVDTSSPSVSISNYVVLIVLIQTEWAGNQCNKLIFNVSVGISIVDFLWIINMLHHIKFYCLSF